MCTVIPICPGLCNACNHQRKLNNGSVTDGDLHTPDGDSALFTASSSEMILRCGEGGGRRYLKRDSPAKRLRAIRNNRRSSANQTNEWNWEKIITRVSGEGDLRAFKIVLSRKPYFSAWQLILLNTVFAAPRMNSLRCCLKAVNLVLWSRFGGLRPGHFSPNKATEDSPMQINK